MSADFAVDSLPFDTGKPGGRFKQQAKIAVVAFPNQQSSPLFFLRQQGLPFSFQYPAGKASQHLRRRCRRPSIGDA